MSITLSAAPGLYRRLRAHLLQDDVEQVAFLVAVHHLTNELRLDDLYGVPPSEFDYQGPLHVSLMPDVRAKVIKWAWDRKACLVEAHSHRGQGAAEFSASDIAGLMEFVPHVWWRLRGRPYVALVFTEDSFDALAWIRGPLTVESVEILRVGDSREDRPTGLTHSRLARRSTHAW